MKKYFAPLLGLVVALGFFMPELVDAQLIQPGVDNPSNIANATGGEGSARTLGVRIVNFFLTFLGLIATLMLIYGGFLYMTSAGEDTEKAKKVLIYAGVGIIVVLISFAVVNTLLGAGL